MSKTKFFPITQNDLEVFSQITLDDFWKKNTDKTFDPAMSELLNMLLPKLQKKVKKTFSDSQKEFLAKLIVEHVSDQKIIEANNKILTEAKKPTLRLNLNIDKANKVKGSNYAAFYRRLCGPTQHFNNLIIMHNGNVSDTATARQKKLPERLIAVLNDDKTADFIIKHYPYSFCDEAGIQQIKLVLDKNPSTIKKNILSAELKAFLLKKSELVLEKLIELTLLDDALQKIWRLENFDLNKIEDKLESYKSLSNSNKVALKKATSEKTDAAKKERTIKVHTDSARRSSVPSLPLAKARELSVENPAFLPGSPRDSFRDFGGSPMVSPAASPRPERRRTTKIGSLEKSASVPASMASFRMLSLTSTRRRNSTPPTTPRSGSTPRSNKERHRSAVSSRHSYNARSNRRTSPLLESPSSSNSSETKRPTGLAPSPPGHSQSSSESSRD